MKKDYLPQAQQELEKILNEEVYATQSYREGLVDEYFQRISTGKTIFLGAPKNLSREDVKNMLKENRGFAHIRKNSPYILGGGEHQILIGLENNLVAKTRYTGDQEYPFTIGRRPFNFIKETRDSLLGLGIDVPEMHFCRFYWQDGKLIVSSDVFHDSRTEMLGMDLDSMDREYYLNREKYPNVCITSDLREGGRYTVEDYDGRRVKGLINGDFISSQFRQISKRLEALKDFLEYNEDGSEFVLSYEPHLVRNLRSWKEGRKKAIRRMFLVQRPVDPSEEGKLVVGDIDHIYVFRRTGSII